MAKQAEIDEHNKAVLAKILEEKHESIVAKKITLPSELKTGTKEIRQAYFKQWYDSCKDIYNKERRRKRKEKKKEGKGNG